MAKLHYLRPTDLRLDCDACGTAFDLMTGGTCEACERILCARHLHGSWLARMVHEFRRPVRCVDCRAGHPVSAPGAPLGALSNARRPGPSRGVAGRGRRS